MRKVLKNSSEVCHVFARQSQDEGRCSNVFFNKNLIYSYGYHFCMANVLDLNRVMITDRTYSVTTSKHLSEIRYALNHYDRLFVPYPEKKFRENSEVWQRRIKEQIDILNNTRKRPQTKENAKGELSHIVSSIDKYLEWTNQKMTGKEFKEFRLFYDAAKDNQALADLQEKLEKRRKLDEATNKRRRKAQLAKQEENLKLWVNGESIRVWSFDEIEKVYLRSVVYTNEEDSSTIEEVETSKGARVSLKSAKVLFDLIRAGKDIKGHVIDGYTVISLNGVLTIGCHKIERDEIERFAKTQNWI
jgi:hypothetical protein